MSKQEVPFRVQNLAPIPDWNAILEALNCHLHSQGLPATIHRPMAEQGQAAEREADILVPVGTAQVSVENLNDFLQASVKYDGEVLAMVAEEYEVTLSLEEELRPLVEPNVLSFIVDSDGDAAN